MIFKIRGSLTVNLATTIINKVKGKNIRALIKKALPMPLFKPLSKPSLCSDANFIIELLSPKLKKNLNNSKKASAVTMTPKAMGLNNFANKNVIARDKLIDTTELENI